MSGLVTVITPTVPGRELLLDECIASVRAQTVDTEQSVGVDSDRVGPAVLRNRLASGVQTEWLLPVDDDDLLAPDCVARLLDVSDDADIVYPWCRIDPGITALVNKLWDRAGLHRMNYIPVTALIRRDTWNLLGGQRNVPMEDWDFLRRADLHGCRFKCVPEVLWHYRAHRGQHFQGAAA